MLGTEYFIIRIHTKPELKRSVKTMVIFLNKIFNLNEN